MAGLRWATFSVALTVLLAGCGGGAPRKPTPPARDESLRKERFSIPGLADDWAEPLPILDGLKRTGGVVDAYVEEETGKYVVVYDPRRTHRDKLNLKLVQIGRDQNRSFDPLWDDR